MSLVSVSGTGPGTGSGTASGIIGIIPGIVCWSTKMNELGNQLIYELNFKSFKLDDITRGLYHILVNSTVFSLNTTLFEVISDYRVKTVTFNE